MAASRVIKCQLSNFGRGLSIVSCATCGPKSMKSDASRIRTSKWRDLFGIAWNRFARLRDSRSARSLSALKIGSSSCQRLRRSRARSSIISPIGSSGRRMLTTRFMKPVCMNRGQSRSPSSERLDRLLNRRSTASNIDPSRVKWVPRYCTRGWHLIAPRFRTGQGRARIMTAQPASHLGHGRHPWL